MEQYEKFVSKGILNPNGKIIPSKVVTEGSHLSKYFPVGTTSPEIKEVTVSADQFRNFMARGLCKDKKYVYHIIVQDEGKVTSYDDCMLRYHFLQYLKDEVPYAVYHFRLSDSSLPAYISFMESMNWDRDANTAFQMVLNRHDPDAMKIPLDQARGRLYLSEEDLLWASDSVLNRLRNKVDELTLHDTFRLKQAIAEYCDQIDRRYYKAYLTDFDKAYLAYHYLFDPKSFNNIDIEPLGIGFAHGQISTDKNGFVSLKKSLTRWESRPVGTLDHKQGVCTGQARLFSSLLWNPEMKVPAMRVFGTLPTGEEHCWSEFQAHGLTYQCCTTMKGLFQDLDEFGYKPNADEYFPHILPHDWLEYESVEKVKQHVKSLRK